MGIYALYLKMDYTVLHRIEGVILEKNGWRVSEMFLKKKRPGHQFCSDTSTVGLTCCFRIEKQSVPLNAGHYCCGDAIPSDVLL